jgi:hypothetical protein
MIPKPLIFFGMNTPTPVTDILEQDFYYELG